VPTERGPPLTTVSRRRAGEDTHKQVTWGETCVVETARAVPATPLEPLAVCAAACRCVELHCDAMCCLYLSLVCACVCATVVWLPQRDRGRHAMPGRGVSRSIGSCEDKLVAP
jgi:hypothetical protein